MRGSTLIKTISTVGAAALLTSGCLASGSSSTSTSSSTAAGGGASTSSSGGGGADLQGKTVTIWASLDQPIIDGLQKASTSMAQASGMTIKWQKVDNINQVIMTKLGAADAPDIVLVPQPGVAADIVKRGKATALDGILDMTALKSSMVPGTLDSGTVNGKLYGLLVSINAKSFVWYPKKAWDAAGYKAPESIDELNTLTDQMKSKGQVPWCMGIESGGATGWPATDWFEDLIMRYGGVDQYNSWVQHKVLFNSDLVKQAAAEFEKLMFTDGNVLGGRKAISTTAFGTAGNAMFDAKPGCMMYKQGSFITGFFPKAVQADLDNQVGLFYFPPAKTGGDKPLLGGGDMAVLLKDSPQAEQAMKFLADKDLGKEAMGTSFLSPHKDFDTTLYKGGIQQQVAKITYESSAFLFDGSDQMPGAVGSGTFWKDMTAWISGQENLDTALKNIDSSWPS